MENMEKAGTVPAELDATRINLAPFSHAAWNPEDDSWRNKFYAGYTGSYGNRHATPDPETSQEALNFVSDYIRPHKQWASDSPAYLLAHTLRHCVAHFMDDWIYREALREKRPQLTIPAIPGHFLHVSKADPKLVAFTPSRDHGIADRQVRLTLGKYLNRYQEELGLSASAINELVRLWNLQCAPTQLHITSDADEIVRIYRHGPDSCMIPQKVRHEPVRAYAGPDTAVAALYQGDWDHNPEILARTVINKKTRGWIRIFSSDDEARERLEHLLEEAGYEENDDLSEVRLALKRDDEGVHCPYLDGSPYMVDIEEDYLVIRRNGPYDGQNSNGYVEEVAVCTCEECGGRVDEDEITYVEGHGSFCDTCLHRNYSYAYVGRYQEWVHDNEVYGRTSDGEAYTAEGASYHDMEKPEDSDYLYSRDDLYLVEGTDKYYFDRDNAESDGYTRAEDGSLVDPDDLPDEYVQSVDGLVWRKSGEGYGQTEVDDCNSEAEDGEWVPHGEENEHDYYEIENAAGDDILCHESRLYIYGYELRDGKAITIQQAEFMDAQGELNLEPLPPAPPVEEAVAYG